MSRTHSSHGYLHAMLAVVLGVLSLAAHAQENARHSNEFEFTPFAGYLDGGEFENSAGDKLSIDQSSNLGLIFNYAPEYWRAYEFLYTRTSTNIGGAAPADLDIDYLQIGGIVSYPDAVHVIPYFGLGVGAARLSPNVSGWDDETKLAFSAATGVRVPIGDHFGVRFDVRAFLTTLKSDDQIFCEANDGATCDIRTKGDTLFQYSAALGFIVGF